MKLELEDELIELRRLALDAAQERSVLEQYKDALAAASAGTHLAAWINALKRALAARQDKLSLTYDRNNFGLTLMDLSEPRRVIYAAELERLLGEPFKVSPSKTGFEIEWLETF